MSCNTISRGIPILLMDTPHSLGHKLTLWPFSLLSRFFCLGGEYYTCMKFPFVFVPSTSSNLFTVSKSPLEIFLRGFCLYLICKTI